MESTSPIAVLFREVILNGTWIANTNCKNELSDLDWKLATAKFETLNTIAVLDQNIHYHINGITKCLGVFCVNILVGRRKFASLIEQMPEEKLQHNFINEKYGSYQLNIDVMIEHTYYHLGQIVLIKSW